MNWKNCWENNIMAKVNIRGGFSDRNKIKIIDTEIQLKDFDQRTRIQLQNMVIMLYKGVYDDAYYRSGSVQNFCKYVIGTIYSEPIDLSTVYDIDAIFEMISQTIQKDDYDDVLTLIEGIIQYWDEYLIETRGYSYYDEYTSKYVKISLFQTVNEYFEREYVGYRFIDGKIISISDSNEVAAIVEALECEYEVVRNHISKANGLLADREHPDYENSIKESISAVEAICEILTGIKGKEATLGKMLKKLEENGVMIHSGLKSAFNTLYGYTSDANGIRHAGDIGGKSSTFEEAKFMLVSCCAFINYLIAVSAD